MRFYLSRALPAEDKEELARLIRQHGGVVSGTPAGATQLVDCDKLDARRPEWISANFIRESVAFRALQDPAKYSGAVFTARQESRGSRRRIRYTNEEDTRLLHFAKQRGWKATEPLPLSVWQAAEGDRVTAHTAYSMHQRFRKRLRTTTPAEQRTIMSNAAAVARARLLGREEEIESVDEDDEEAEEQTQEQEQKQKQAPRAWSSPSPTGFQDVAMPESTTSTQSRSTQRLPRSASREGAATSGTATIESRLRQVEEEKFSGRARSRKPKSPLRLSQRLHPSEGVHSSSNRSHSTATPPTPATPEAQGIEAAQSILAPSAGSTSVPPSRDQKTERKQQKRKRSTARSDTTNSQESSSSHQEVACSDAESADSTISRDNGIFFRSVWMQQLGDQRKSRMLQRFFQPHAEPASQSFRASCRASVAGSDPNGAAKPSGIEARENLDEDISKVQEVEQATDKETDEIIARLQLDMHQDMASVVHALYCCSGDVELARTFLKSASPPGMWFPEDDLLLVNLVAEESTSPAAVDAAVARGDFRFMQVVRDTDTILKRVKFLR
ncbi:Telomeric repeat-binding factor 2-interacting protein 1 [Phytophthora cinnamomi]|uniref:Telomeric repeat-binding factor 2-interacting protein 1 n=1 Tax=Phytophthora cinnamomi TaxID=4785 RepID=UPI00355A6E61|nr:Telomeric repeat-binding factor 2-interacting protein 1 [Phytophthora cinnamomi]